MITESRNDPLGFAKRTLKNLQFIENACSDHNSNPDVHVVTQIVNSMLGLIVFPHASQFDSQAEPIFKKVGGLELENLDSNLRKWNIQENTYNEKCEILGNLIKHIRNGASHRRMRFSSDSRNPCCVFIEICDQDGKKQKRWKASIRADDLRSFCLAFIELLEQKSAGGPGSTD